MILEKRNIARRQIADAITSTIDIHANLESLKASVAGTPKNSGEFWTVVIKSFPEGMIVSSTIFRGSTRKTKKQEKREISLIRNRV
jgi:hypothetical protein